MPRIQPLEPSQAPAEAQHALDALNKKLGRIPNIFKTMSHAPAILEAYMGFSGSMAKSSLPTVLREQIALACAGFNGCDYCASAHTAIGKGAGLSDAQADAALHGKSDDVKAQAAITFARELIAHPQHVTDAQFAALKDAGFTDAQTIEIVGAVVFNLLTNFFNHLAATDVDFQPAVDTSAAVQRAEK